MKHFSAIQLAIIEQLSDGHCHSGSVIGKTLGVSRTAIWKHIAQLIEAGVPIKSIANQGYQLMRPFIPLSRSKIAERSKQDSDIHVFAEIDSTNTYLKELTTDNPITVCCAESQIKGRGRFGRQWVSPFGENIYLSFRQQIDCCLSQLSGLSLVISLAVHHCLKRFIDTEDIKIKWPNDLIWNQKKLGGVLIEMIAEGNGSTQIIIGIGLNVNTATHEHPLDDKPWCSLHEISGLYFDRNQIIGHLLNDLADYLNEFLLNGFDVFMARWHHVDYLFGKSIEVQQNIKLLHGIAKGIDSTGQLLLLHGNGVMQALSSGDTSLKRFVLD